MIKEIRKEELREELKELFEDEDILLSCWNEYNVYDNVYNMEEFDEIFSNEKPSDLVNKIFYGDFNPNHDFFIFNGYGNLKSSDYLDDLLDADELINNIINNEDCCYCDEVQEILDKYIEEEI